MRRDQAERERLGQKDENFFFCSEGAKGLAVVVFRRRGVHSSELVSSSLTVLRALCPSICIISITNTYDIIACVLWQGN